ncbi:MAG TPA: hypothetical protein VF349_04345, partial [Candidatus Limnocylindrales bacterium]
LALYEPPYGSPAGGRGYDSYEPKLNRLLAAGKRGEAVELFMSVVGVPPDMIAGMRQSPGWPAMEAIAPTLAYDAACMNGFAIPYDRTFRIQAPTLAMNGGEGFDFMRTTAKALAEAIPNARYLELPGQRHDVDAKVLATVLAEFFCAAPAGVPR